LGLKIAGSVSQVGMHDFSEKFSLLESLFEYWQCDIPIAIVCKEIISMKEQHETIGDSTVKRQDDENDETKIEQHNIKDDNKEHLRDFENVSEMECPPTSGSCVTQVASIIASLDTVAAKQKIITTSSLVDKPVLSANTCMKNSALTGDEKLKPLLHNEATKSVLTEINGLNVKDICSSIKIKPRIKCKGHPKGTSSLWPSKKRKIDCESQIGTQHNNSKRKALKGSVPSKLQMNGNIEKFSKRIHIQGTPAYRRAIRSKRKLANKLSEIVGIQDDNGKVENASSHNPAEDWKLLQSKSWLNANLINSGMELMKLKFPHINGLQNCTLSDTLNFKPLHDEFVQVLNCSGTHWICVSTFGCPPGKVNMFDSMRSDDIPLNTKEAIATLVCTTRKSILLSFVDVQQQLNGYDCGLFALAYTSSICNGVDLMMINYSRHESRSHFKCLTKGEHQDFPVESSTRKPGCPLSSSFREYYICRLPDGGMI